MNFLRREPVLVAAFANAALSIILAWGVDLTAEQLVAIMSLTIVGFGVLARQRVSPV